MRYHLFQKFFEKVVKIKETSFLLSKCLVSIGQHCTAKCIFHSTVVLQIQICEFKKSLEIGSQTQDKL